MVGVLGWGLMLAALWLLWARLAHWVLAPGLRGGDPIANAAYRLIQVYTAVVHRLRVSGREHVPAREADGRGPKPLIIVSNHTAGVDPLLIQSALPFEVRWVMASDMRAGCMERVWRFGRVIFVDRTGEALGLREALRHLRQGGTLGMFPEGGIERPPRRLLPFQEGVGVLIARTGALVLPVVVEGTPAAGTAWGSLFKFSRARVRFLPTIDYPGPSDDPAGIVAGLREVFARATGWPPADPPAASAEE